MTSICYLTLSFPLSLFPKSIKNGLYKWHRNCVIRMRKNFSIVFVWMVIRKTLWEIPKGLLSLFFILNSFHTTKKILIHFISDLVNHKWVGKIKASDVDNRLVSVLIYHQFHVSCATWWDKIINAFINSLNECGFWANNNSRIF